MTEYAGLEIRIGGDTTKLNNALKTSTKSAATLQKEIRQITRAMQFDPSDFSNLDTRLKLTAERMESLQAKVKTMHTALDQLGDTKVSFTDKLDNGTIVTYTKSVKTLAEQTDNVQLSFENARKRYADLTGTLERSYETWNKIAHESGAELLAGYTHNIGDAREMMELPLGELKQELAQFQDQFGQRIPKSVQQTILSLKKVDFHDAFRTDTVDNMIASLEGMGVELGDEAGKIKALSAQYNDAKNNMQAWQKAATFQQLSVDIQRTNSEIESLSREMRELNTVSSVEKTDEFQKLEARVRAADDQIKRLDDDIEACDRSLKLDPSNLDAAKQKMIDLSEKAALAKDKEDALNQELRMLDTDSVREAAAGHENLSEWLIEARSDAASANKSYRDQLATLNNLRAEYQQVKDTVDRLTAAEAGIAKNLPIKQKAQELESARLRVSELEDEFNTLGEKMQYVSSEDEFESLSADIDNVGRELNEARDRADQLQRELDEISSTDDKDWINYDTASESLRKAVDDQKRLAEQIDEAKQSAKEAKGAYEAANQELDSANAAGALKEVNAELRNATDQAKSAANEMNNVAEKARMIEPSTLKSLGMTLYSTLTPAISMLGYKVMDASETIDSAYRDMRKTVNGTEAQFESLRESAVRFSNTHVTSADQIMEIQAIGGELGVATESLDAFAEAVSNIDVATDLDTDEAATAIGHLQNILHMTGEDYGSFSDSLVRLGNNGASTESEIVSIAERIGSMASIVGMSTPQVLAWSSAIASTGQESEAAGTAISKTMSFMETAVAAAGGTVDMSFENISSAVQEGGDRLTMFSNLMGMTADEFVDSWGQDPQSVFGELENNITDAKDSLQQIADVAGMSADKFAATWESDPTAALEAFIKGLNGIEQAGGSADAVLQGMKITSVRQKQAIEGLMQTVGGLDDNLQMSQDAWDGVSDQWGQAGDAANEASKKAEGFSGQLQIMKNMAQNAAAELGEGAVPILKMFTGQLMAATDAFSGLPQEAKTGIVAGMGISALIGPGLTLASTLMTMGDEVTKFKTIAISGSAAVGRAFDSGGMTAVRALTEGMTAGQQAKAVATSLGKSLAKLGAYALIAVSIGAVAKMVYDLYQAEKLAQDATEGLDTAVGGIGESMEVAADGMRDATVNIKTLRDEISSVQQGNSELAGGIRQANDEYGKTAGALDAYMGIVDELAGKTDLNAQEQTRLKTALEAINQECGTNYGLNANNEIVDNNTGKVQENTTALWDNVNARKAAALIEYYQPQYVDAIGRQAEAQKALDDAQENYNRVLSSRAQIEQGYIDQGRSREEAERAYRAELDYATQSLQDAQEAADSADGAVDELEQSITDATEQQGEYNRVTQDTTGLLSRMKSAFGEDSALFNSTADTLDALGVGYDSLADASDDNLKAIGTSTQRSMADVVNAVSAAGGDLTVFQQALANSGVGAESLANVSSAAFMSLYQSCGSDINATIQQLAALGIASGDVGADMISAFASMDSGVVSSLQNMGLYNADFIRALQEAGVTSGQLSAISSEDFAAMLANCGGDIDRLISMILGYNSVEMERKRANIDVEGANELAQALRNLDRWNNYPQYYKLTREVAFKVTGSQQAASNFARLDAMDRSATGSVSRSPFIPRHASGYIATAPTMTNHGWVGEAGAEAVVNWATGGTVIPLTNTKYMRPIADAIATEMGGGSASSTWNVNIYGASTDSPEDFARRFVRKARQLEGARG